MTPEQLQELISVLEKWPAETKEIYRDHLIEIYRAHAAALEKLKAAEEALLSLARDCEALKRPCSEMDPESPQAIRNGTYQSIALNARAALAAIRRK